MLSRIFEIIFGVTQKASQAWLFSGPAVLYLLWRIWAFTIKPCLRPNEPKELPYWVPVLGHAIEYVRNAQGVITRGREYFGNTREPFALTLGGEKLYFLTAADDVSSLYKNTQSLDFDKIVYELSIMFDVSHDSMDRMYCSPNSELDDIPSQTLGIKNPKLKSLEALNKDLWKQQLLPGEIYYSLEAKFVQYIEKMLRPESIAECCVISTGHPSKKTVSLQRLTQMVLLDAALSAFFGDKILEMEPNLPQDFLDFDEDNWQLWYRWPNAKAMHKAKSKVTTAIHRWLAVPREERKGMSHVVDTFERSQRAIGLPEEDIAKILTMVVFVSNTNTYKICFWSLAYILHDPTLLATVLSEVKPALQPPNAPMPLSTTYLMDSCPYTAAVFHEALRLCSATSSVRLVNTPTSIGGKVLPKGSRVVAPIRQMHFNSEYFGPNVDEFDPERFVKNKSLTHNQGYRPFGGGISYCPGRFIARQEVMIFVALFLTRFETRVVGDGKFPQMNDQTPPTGLMCPRAGEDVLIELTPNL